MTVSTRTRPPGLLVVPGSVVGEVLASADAECHEIIARVYVDAAHDQLVNPDSLFLRPDSARRDRIIALPAWVPANPPAVGLKWISSFPGNVARGLPRASALIVLNDPETGHPVAVLEGARISACRTALSAVVGADALRPGDRQARTLAVVGTGLIADTTVRALHRHGWSWDSLRVHDLDPRRAQGFAGGLADTAPGGARVVDDLAATLDGADLVLFATTAVEPHVPTAQWLRPGALVLHLSLRDLAPAAMAGAEHVVDDVTHALRERTSLGLAVAAGLVDVDEIVPVGALLDGALPPKLERTVIYSPFGLGSLDIALAQLVLERARDLPGVVAVPDFAGG